MSKLICADCGTVSEPKLENKGGCLIELVLWIFFIIPGLIYTIWRRTGRKQICAACGSRTLVPLDSPRGKKLAAEFGAR